MDELPPTPDPWRDAHQAARALHDALRQLGVPETVLGPLTARQDAAGVHRVIVPPLPVRDVDLLLRALGPALGPAPRSPALIGRRDTAPELPEHPTDAAGTARGGPHP